MITLTSQLGDKARILVNQDDISTVVRIPDGSSVVTMKTGQALQVQETVEQISSMLSER